MAYDSINPGEPMEAANVQQIIEGITGTTAQAHTFMNDSASTWAVTVRSSDTTNGQAFRVRNAADSANLLTVDKNGVHVGAGSLTGTSIGPDGDPDTGFYFPAADNKMGLVAGGVEVARATGSSGGLFTWGGNHGDSGNIFDMAYEHGTGGGVKKLRVRGISVRDVNNPAQIHCTRFAGPIDQGYTTDNVNPGTYITCGYIAGGAHLVGVGDVSLASMQFKTDPFTAWSTGSGPMQLNFLTAKAGAASLNEQDCMVMDSNGHVSIGRDIRNAGTLEAAQEERLGVYHNPGNVPSAALTLHHMTNPTDGQQSASIRFDWTFRDSSNGGSSYQNQVGVRMEAFKRGDFFGGDASGRSAGLNIDVVDAGTLATRLQVTGVEVKSNVSLNAAAGLNVSAGSVTLPANSVARAALATLPAARVRKTANQTLTTGLATAIQFDAERYDTNGIHDNASNNTRLTCQTAGKYRIGGCVAFASNATGERQLYVRLNGSTILEIQQQPAISGNDTAVSVGTEYELAQGDYVELVAYQNSGGNLDVRALGNYSPEFWMSFMDD